MPWHHYERLLKWQDQWEKYLKDERSKLYDGNKHQRRNHIRDLDAKA